MTVYGPRNNVEEHLVYPKQSLFYLTADLNFVLISMKFEEKKLAGSALTSCQTRLIAESLDSQGLSCVTMQRFVRE